MNGHHRGNGASPGVIGGGSGAGTPNADATSKFGSPLAGSPGRWGPIFHRQYEENEAKKHAAAASAGAFGHVGSPLRNSSLSADIARMRNLDRPDTTNNNNEGISTLSQQLARTRIDGGNEGEEDSVGKHLVGCCCFWYYELDSKGGMKQEVNKRCGDLEKSD